MADGTHIEWSEATWNPITGCTVVSQGCKNCYAMQLAGTRLKHHESRAGLTRQNAHGYHVWTGEVRLNEGWLDQPLRWKRQRMIFVCAHGDLFHESVPDAWIDRVFAVMALCPQHTFQVLTKRADRMREYMRNLCRNDEWLVARAADRLKGERPSNTYASQDGVLPNVWLGVSVEDQATANARIPLLLDTPAAIRWISAEPLLGALDLTQVDLYPFLMGNRARSELDPACTFNALTGQTNVHRSHGVEDPFPHGLNWIVAGGESGSNARPLHPDWARSPRDQCAADGVAFFFKQWGEWVPCTLEGDLNNPDDCAAYPLEGCSDPNTHNGTQECRFWLQDGTLGHWTDVTKTPAIGARRIGKVAAGRTLDGVIHDAMPEVRA